MSNAALAQMFAPESNKPFLPLLKIENAAWDDPVYLVRNTEDITSNGDTYSWYPFDVAFPGDSDQIELTVSLCNSDRSYIAQIRSATPPFTVTLSMVVADTPDTIELGPYALDLKTINYDQFIIEGKLSYESIMNETYPGDSFTPDLFPALF